MEAATQPRDGCAAGVGNGRAQGALRPMFSVLATESPVFRVGVGGAVLDPCAGSRSGKALVPRGTLSGEQGSIRRAAPGRGWTLQVSQARNAGKSQKLTRLSPRRRANGRVWGPFGPHCSLRLSSRFAGCGEGPTLSTARSSVSAAATVAAAPGSAPRGHPPTTAFFATPDPAGRTGPKDRTPGAASTRAPR